MENGNLRKVLDQLTTLLKKQDAQRVAARLLEAEITSKKSELARLLASKEAEPTAS